MAEYESPLSYAYRKPVYIYSTDPRVSSKTGLEQYRSRSGSTVIVREVPTIQFQEGSSGEYLEPPENSNLFSYAYFYGQSPRSFWKLYIPKAEDGYLLTNLASEGQTLISPTSLISVNNGYIHYSLNGENSGAIGAGGEYENPNNVGIRIDFSGNGQFGQIDYLTPGEPWEGMRFISDTTGQSVTASNSFVATECVSAWEMNENVEGMKHYMFLYKKNNFGNVVVQYKTEPKTAIIRIHMLYLNTTNNIQRIFALRGMDPDPDFFDPEYSIHAYSTEINQRGYGNIPAENIAFSQGYSGRQAAIYTKTVDGIINNSAISTYWPLYFPWNILDGTDNDAEGSAGDPSISLGWDLGEVLPNEYKYITCAYIFNDIEDNVDKIILNDESILYNGQPVQL